MHIRMCDDFLFIGDTPSAVQASMNTARGILEGHGLRINEAKTEGPTQRITFLGLGLDSTTQTSFVPQDKVASLLQLAGDMRSRDSTQLRHVRTLIGKFSFAAAVLPGARPFFAQLIDSTKHYSNKFISMPVTAAMKDDLDMWSHFLTHWNGQARWSTGGRFIIEHDASKSGFGFALVDTPDGFDQAALPAPLRTGHGYMGAFALTDMPAVRHSIQWAELFAIATSLALYGPHFRNASVLVRTDNITDVFIIKRQYTSKKPLLRLLRSICLTCAHYNTTLEAEHIAGVDNELADYLSRPNEHRYRARVHLHDHTHMHTHYINSSQLSRVTSPRRPPSIT
jgi:hypothetical protein